ncbi:hypothetical protein [Yeosuana marina]|uniref:hypothetical protein n=1 Tax=Yeosuana marina TaxID=1565536 RepID=UPI0014213C36|nr:hypothetical protein [Yeosuana marina]
MEVRVKYKQSLLDIAIQQYGSIAEAFVLAVENNLSVTDIIVPGTIINIPVLEASNPEVQTYYSKKQIKPSTALSSIDLVSIENTDPCDLCKLFK